MLASAALSSGLRQFTARTASSQGLSHDETQKQVRQQASQASLQPSVPLWEQADLDSIPVPSHCNLPDVVVSVLKRNFFGKEVLRDMKTCKQACKAYLSRSNSKHGRQSCCRCVQQGCYANSEFVSAWANRPLLPCLFLSIFVCCRMRMRVCQWNLDTRSWWTFKRSEADVTTTTLSAGMLTC